MRSDGLYSLLSKGRTYRNTFANQFSRWTHHRLQNLPCSLDSGQKLRLRRSDFIDLYFASHRQVKVNKTWLRHHCRCNNCFTWKTHEHISLPERAWLSLEVSKVITVDENELILEWSDGHTSNFCYEYLLRSCPQPQGMHDEGNWKASEVPSYPVTSDFTSTKDPLNGTIVSSTEFMESENGIRHLMTSLWKTGFGVIVGVNGLEKTTLVHNRFSHPLRTMYGDGVTVCFPNQEHNDAAYTSLPLPLHTDTSYFTEPMGLQTFHILFRSQTGGLNSFSDGFLASKLLYEENPAMYDILTKIPLPFQFLDRGRYDLRSLAPTLVSHPLTAHLEQIRYNPRHVTTLSHLPINRIQDFYEAFIRFTELLNENTMWIQLEPGMILWINNWRILHGRSGFTGHRSLASAYFTRSDWLSRARVLGLDV